MRILDATASVRSIWYQKENPFTVFMDMRCGTFSGRTEHMKRRNDIYKIYPDVIAKWQCLPFRDESFDMIVFDPPHLFKDVSRKLPGIANKYGIFYNQSWRQELSDGFIELFRALKPNGVFILKWNEFDVEINEVLKLIPYPPMFGTRTGQKNNTHWITFIKYQFNRTFEEFSIAEVA